MITTDKIIGIYCIADGFLKEYEFEIQNRTALTTNELKTRNRASQLSHSEIMTILVGFHYGIFCNFKHYYLFYIKQHLKYEFPNAVSYNRFVELQARVLIPLMLFLQLIGFGKCIGITYVDSTKISVCIN